MGTYRNRFGPHNPDETYVAHAFPEQLVDLGEVQMNYVVVGRSRRAGAAADPRADASRGGATSRPCRCSPSTSRSTPSTCAVRAARPARPVATRSTTWATTSSASSTSSSAGPTHRQRAVVGRRAVGVAVRVRQARSGHRRRLRGSAARSRPRSSRAVGHGIRQAIGPMFHLWSTYLGDQWSIGDWDGMRAAAPDVLPWWPPACSSSRPSRRRSSRSTTPSGAAPSGAAASPRRATTSGCSEPWSVPVLFTHHFRHSRPATGVLLGAVSDLQAAACPARCSPPPASASTTGRSRRWATPCTGRIPGPSPTRSSTGRDEPPGEDEPGGVVAGDQISRRSLAHAVSWWRLESCSLRRTADTWVSIVFTDRWRRLATSLYA